MGMDPILAELHRLRAEAEERKNSIRAVEVFGPLAPTWGLYHEPECAQFLVGEIREGGLISAKRVAQCVRGCEVRREIHRISKVSSIMGGPKVDWLV
jgi:hypothetical protein